MNKQVHSKRLRIYSYKIADTNTAPEIPGTFVDMMEGSGYRSYKVSDPSFGVVPAGEVIPEYVAEGGLWLPRIRKKPAFVTLSGKALPNDPSQAIIWLNACTCTTADLMAGGCRCGAVQREKGEQL